MNYRLLIGSAALILTQSCVGGFGFVYEDHLFGNYYLIAVDEQEQMSLSYHAPEDGNTYGGVVPETVFGVGYNDKFIIVEQHPREFPKPANKDITNYFIVPITGGFNYRTMNGMMGPMTMHQFTVKRHELKISDSLRFTKVLEDLK